MKVLKSYDEIKPYIAQVREFADGNKSSFGFLPGSAYEEIAFKEQLWVLCDAERNIQGYLIFGGVYPKLKVFQLFSCQNFRGRGGATILLDELKRYAESHSYLCISARVAADLSANKFWGKSGFNICQQQKGGKSTNRVLNLRVYQLEGQDLLSSSGVSSEHDDKVNYLGRPILANRTYAIDLNPIFDVTKSRAKCVESTLVLQRGFSGSLDLCTTPEFVKEFERNSGRFKEDPMLAIAKAIPALPVVSEDMLFPVIEELREVIFPQRSKSGATSKNDRSDLIHIAYCIFHRVSGFITREKALLKASRRIYEQYSIKILSPSELLDCEREGLRVDIKSGDKCLSVSGDVSSFLHEVEEFLQLQGLGSVSARSLVSKGCDSDSERLIVRFGGSVVGYATWSVASEMNNVVDLHLFVDERTPGIISSIDHVLECSINGGKQGSVIRIDLHVGGGQTLTKETALNRGFIQGRESGSLSKVSHGGYVDKTNWWSFKRGYEGLSGLLLPDTMPTYDELLHTGIAIHNDKNVLIKCLSLFDFETLISPGFLFPKGRGALMLPIKESYAKGLLGDLRGQLDLMPSEEVTHLLERAYFRSSSRLSYFSKGELLLLYVSGKDSIQEVVGLGRITSSEKMTASDAGLNLKRQGVLSEEDLECIGGSKGVLHAFTFDNFNEFNNRVSFQEAKKLGAIGGANLTTVEKVEYKALKKVLEIVE